MKKKSLLLVSNDAHGGNQPLFLGGKDGNQKKKETHFHHRGFLSGGPNALFRDSDALFLGD